MPPTILTRPRPDSSADLVPSPARRPARGPGPLAGPAAAQDRAQQGCFHCGQALPAPAGILHAELEGRRRAFCCGGCLTLARTLHQAGFGHLYDAQTRFARPLDGAALEEAQAVWLAYDTPELARQFVRDIDGERAEMTLAPEHIRCAACAWLIEERLSALPAVESVVANVATRRVVVRWRRDRLPVSRLLAEFALLGYPAWPFEVSRSDLQDRRARRGLLMRMAVAMLGMMQVMMYAWPLYTHEQSIEPGQLQLMRWASLALTLPVVVYSASGIFGGAWRDLRARRVGMDVPVALGIGAAFAASVTSLVTGKGEVYFDSVTMFVAFLLLARYLELRVRQASRSGAEMLARQLPATCERLPEWNAGASALDAGTERVPVVRLQPGDRVLVRAGEIVPADGLVLSGASDVDESMLTGESRPVGKRAGSRVLAGCFNAASPLVVRVERVGAATRLSEIVGLLDRALAEKPRLAELADRVAGWFIAVLLGLAAATALVWWHLEPSRMLSVTIAVLVVSCPCALSLATPAALAAAGAALSRRGLLITRAHALETLAGVTDVMLDKTGTLTEGSFALVATHAAGEAAMRRHWLAVAAALERSAEHPIARGIVDADGSEGSEDGGQGVAVAAYGSGRDGEPRAIDALRNVPGQGIEAVVDGCLMRLGRRNFVLSLAGEAAPGAAYLAPRDVPAPRAGATQVWLGAQAGVLAVFELADRERGQTADLLSALRSQGVKCHLVSGDSAPTVQWWAQRLGIETWRGAMTPEDKRAYVEALQRDGSVVLAVGDGINDAPVLAQAQVSVAVGSGAPLAQAGADLVLTHGGIAEIGRALRAARRARAVMRQNLGWAFAYNVIAIPLAATGHVTAWMAGIGMSVSSLLVVANAWRLLRGNAGPAR